MGQTFFLLSCFGVFMMADRESRISIASWSIRRLTLMLLRTCGFKTFLVVKAKTIKRTNWRWISYNIMLDRKPSKNIQPHFEFTGDKNKDCKMSVMHKFKELYQGAKNVIYRATGIMIVSWEEFFSDELRSELLKMPDFTRQATHKYCRTSRSTSLTHQKLLVPNVHFTLLETSRLKKGQLPLPVSVVVTSTHLLNHLAARPSIGKNATNVRRCGKT